IEVRFTKNKALAGKIKLNPGSLHRGSGSTPSLNRIIIYTEGLTQQTILGEISHEATAYALNKAYGGEGALQIDRGLSLESYLRQRRAIIDEHINQLAEVKSDTGERRTFSETHFADYLLKSQFPKALKSPVQA